MKMTPKFAVLGTFIGCFICALVVLSVWLAGGGNQEAQAQGGSGGNPNVLGIDAVPDASNTKTALGTIDRCVQVAGVGSTFDIDVFLDDVPLSSGSYHNLGAVEYRLNYDAAKLKVNATTHNWLITALAGSVLNDFGDCSPMGSACPDTDGQLYVSYLDTKSAFSEGPGSLGVLDRHTLEVVGGAGTLVYLTLTDLGFAGYEPSPTPWQGEIDQVWDGVYALPYGIIAIGTTCPAVPKYADVEIVSQDVKAADCTSDPPWEWDAGVDTVLCLRKSIQNNGPETPVDGSITTTLIQTGGGNDCTITPDGANPATFTALTSTPQTKDEKFTINCTNRCNHDFEFSNEIAVTTAGVTDNVPDNNSDATIFEPDVWGEADLDVTSVTVDAPDSAAVGGAFNVTVTANVSNNGPSTLVTANATLDLTMPAGCTRVPNTTQVVALTNLGDSSAIRTWSVTCTETGSKTFNGSGSVVLTSEHAQDSTSGNNSDTGSDSTEITASADVRIVSWVFPDDMPAQSGKQVRVVPTVPENLVSDETLNNNLANTTYTGTYIDVAINIPVTETGACTATPDPFTGTAQLPRVGTDVTDHPSWSVTLTSGDFCTLEFVKTVTITTPLLGEYDPPTMATRSVDLVADSDQDSVPNNYAGLIDLCPGTAPGAEVDANGCSDAQVDGDSDGICDPAAPSGGPSGCTGSDNCPANYNPDQKNTDGDALGDVCDPDDDNDGVLDAADNCPLIANAGQENADSDSIGNVCELDVTCDGLLDGGDVVQLMRYIVGLLTVSDQCPPPTGSINGPRATAYNDGIDGGDVVAMLQCIAGFHNIVCPAPTAP
jgi:hypothetical protein